VARGSREVAEALKARCKELGLAGEVRVNQAGCLDRCADGPAVVVYPEQCWYAEVQVGDVDELATSHARDGRRVQRLLASVKGRGDNAAPTELVAAELRWAEVLRRALGLGSLTVTQRRLLTTQLDGAMARVEEWLAHDAVDASTERSPSLSESELASLPSVTTFADVAGVARQLGRPTAPWSAP
jgi:(2Fe-2S) ferredoxin